MPRRIWIRAASAGGLVVSAFAFYLGIGLSDITARLAELRPWWVHLAVGATLFVLFVALVPEIADRVVRKWQKRNVPFDSERLRKLRRGFPSNRVSAKESVDACLGDNTRAGLDPNYYLSILDFFIEVGVDVENQEAVEWALMELRRLAQYGAVRIWGREIPNSSPRPAGTPHHRELPKEYWEDATIEKIALPGMNPDSIKTRLEPSGHRKMLPRYCGLRIHPDDVKANFEKLRKAVARARGF